MTKSCENGFTLIELMIVIAIIGILAAIAIPQYDAYRKRSFNSGALWDVKNAATAEESYYIDALSYANGTEPLGDHGFSATEGVTLDVTANADGYTLISYHNNGDKTYTLTGPGGAWASN